MMNRSSPDAAPVLWRLDGRLGHLVLNRPAAGNAIDTAMGASLSAAIHALLDAAPGAVLISSTGPHFCVGGDICTFAARPDDLDVLVAEMLDVVHPAIHRLATAPLPVVAAVQGPLGGAGIGVALCADLVLATPAVKLRGGYSALGLSPDLGVSYWLARRAGAARAKQILMTNRAIPAAECLAWGLVDELHPEDELGAAAHALATAAAHGATAALAGIKALCDGAHAHNLQEHLRLEREALLRAAASPGAAEGVRAFIEKRGPDFARPSRS